MSAIPNENHQSTAVSHYIAECENRVTSLKAGYEDTGWAKAGLILLITTVALCALGFAGAYCGFLTSAPLFLALTTPALIGVSLGIWGSVVSQRNQKIDTAISIYEHAKTAAETDSLFREFIENETKPNYPAITLLKSLMINRFKNLSIMKYAKDHCRNKFEDLPRISRPNFSEDAEEHALYNQSGIIHKLDDLESEFKATSEGAVEQRNALIDRLRQIILEFYKPQPD